MKLSLSAKVTIAIALVVTTISALSTFLFISFQKEALEREIAARGLTLSEALSRAVDDGLAAEQLDIIRAVSDIVHTKDVSLVQVFTPVWLAVDAYPAGKREEAPEAEALQHFAASEEPFYINEAFRHFDFYAPVYYHPLSEARFMQRNLIGYVRVTITTDEVRWAIQRAVFINSAVGALFAVLATLVLNALFHRFVLTPVLRLHASASRHRKGELPELVVVSAQDEIGQLTREFNEMIAAVEAREERLAEEKERLAVTLRSIGDAVIVTDVGGRVTLLNAVAEKLTGWTTGEAAGRRLFEVFRIVNEKTRERSEDPVEKVVRTGAIVGLANHTVLVRRDGTELVIEDSAAPIREEGGGIIGVVIVFRDATTKRRMEEELFKMEKLQTVGLLAGGLAHDFNNILTAIVGNISIAKHYLEPAGKAFDRLTDAEKAVQRAKGLTQQLLTFSKGGAPVRKPGPIAEIILESARLSLSGTSVAPVFEFEQGLPAVEIDAGQMSQVFNNLIINAAQAMQQGGTITFRMRTVPLGEHEVPPLPAGRYVRISVSDTGPGIPKEHLAKIFDAFYTTKHGGSGLGLTSVFSIVKKHDGHVTVESDLGTGTVFHIYLPVSERAPEPKVIAQGPVQRGRGRVLLMDDEQVVRDVAAEILRFLGYDVSVAQAGAEAVELYQKALEEKKRFDALIMDLTVPGGMGGREALQKILTLDPQARAIVSSGYSNDPVMSEYEAHGFKGVITKPYTIENFSRVLKEVVGG